LPTGPTGRGRLTSVWRRAKQAIVTSDADDLRRIAPDTQLVVV
jgi:hypothetical protein